MIYKLIKTPYIDKRQPGCYNCCFEREKGICIRSSILNDDKEHNCVIKGELYHYEIISMNINIKIL